MNKSDGFVHYGNLCLCVLGMSVREERHGSEVFQTKPL